MNKLNRLNQSLKKNKITFKRGKYLNSNNTKLLMLIKWSIKIKYKYRKNKIIKIKGRL